MNVGAVKAPTIRRSHGVIARPATSSCAGRCGRVNDEGIVGDAQVIQRLEDCPHILIVVDHGVLIRALPAPRLTNAGRLGMGAEVHVGRIHPHKKRLRLASR
jgi:hypothetical protein